MKTKQAKHATTISVSTRKCGCRLFGKHSMFVFCKLHTYAPDLLEAAKYAIASNVFGAGESAHMLRSAIAKAEGK